MLTAICRPNSAAISSRIARAISLAVRLAMRATSGGSAGGSVVAGGSGERRGRGTGAAYHRRGEEKKIARCIFFLARETGGRYH